MKTRKRVPVITKNQSPRITSPKVIDTPPRRSQSTSSMQIELIHSETNLNPTYSTFFRTFSEMSKQIPTQQSLKFNKTVSRIPSPLSRLKVQLNHNKNESQAIISYSKEKQREALSSAAQIHKLSNIRVYQKLKKRDPSPTRNKIELKPEHRVFQLPKLDELPEKPPTIPPKLTFYFESQKLIRDVKTFKPSFVEGASLAYYNDNLYLYGGIGGDGIRNQMMKYDIKFQFWQLVDALGDLPKKGRSGLTVVQFRNKFIYFGGSGMYNSKLKMRECYNTIYEFNASTLTWEKLQPQGDYIEPRRHHKACNYGNKWMLVYGGISSNEEVLGDSYLFNIEKQIWKQLEKDSDPVCCHYLVNVSVGNVKFSEGTSDILPCEQVYCFGGKDQQGNSTNTLRKLTHVSGNNTPNGWEVIVGNGKAPQPCHNHTLEYLKKIQGIIVLGGLMDKRYHGSLESGEIFIYYPHLNLWQDVVAAGAMTPRCAHCSIILTHRIAIFGGIGNERYLEPDVGILETDQTQVQAKAMKYNMQQQLQAQAQQLQKTEVFEGPSKKNRKQHMFSYQEDSPQKGFKITLRKALQDRRSFLPQPSKKQIYMRYDLLMGFVKAVILENLQTLQNFDEYLQKSLP